MLQLNPGVHVGKYTSLVEGLAANITFFSIQLDMRPCDFEFQDYFAHSRDAQGWAKPIFFSVGCRQIGWKKHKTRIHGSVRQFGMVWWCLMFDGIWCSIPIISSGNMESTGQLTQGTSISTHNDVTCLEHLLFARTLLSRLRDWLVNKEAETAVQEDWYVWGTAQWFLRCASTKLWMKIRLGFGMYFALSLPAVVSILEGFGGYVQDSGA